MSDYIPRLVDPVLAQRLLASGAIVIDGPKAVGKTETGRRAARSEVLLDSDLDLRQLAIADPRLVLDGASPRLLDEWQSVPNLWNAVRREVDERREKGLFILTGSATPSDDLTRHSGAGRFSRLRMRPMTLVETGHSSGDVSLADLLDGEAPRSAGQNLSLRVLCERMITGGWPASQSLDPSTSNRYALDYLDQVARLEIAGLDDVRHDPRKVGALLRSIARTTASEASNATLARDAGGDAGALHQDTVARYLDALERAFIVDIQPAWNIPLRSRTPLRKAPKRHLTDSSLTAAALRIGSAELLLQDANTLGLLFESFVFQQLRVFADITDANVYHFRSKTGLEVDAIVERANGAWGAFEVKLGAGLIDAGAASLTTFAATIDTSHRPGPAFLAVLVPTGPSYLRHDGISVVALTSLRP
jgi:predicted AAA+ superfamily ATPase